jgi:hypothetical protein
MDYTKIPVSTGVGLTRCARDDDDDGGRRRRAREGGALVSAVDENDYDGADDDVDVVVVRVRVA